jgi:hypothetical protein
VLAALSVARLARALRLSPLAAVVAAAVWALNPHGINMAVLWTSGRTAILLTLFATLAATDWVKGHGLRSAVWTLLALLSKEEAITLPFVLLAWSAVTRRTTDGERDDPATSHGPLWTVAPLAVAMGIYVALRMHSGAFTPANAPPFYRFSSDWRLVTLNAFQYLDRAVTFSAVIAIVAMLSARRVPGFGSDARRVATMSLIWLVGGYAVTVWLPVRSSLYACCPSTGAALVAGALVSGLVRSENRRLVPTLAVVCLVAIISTPVYWARNERWVAPARVSSAVLAQLPGLVGSQPPGTTVVVRDGDNPRENIKAAFATLLPDAIRLSTGRNDIAVWVEPPPGDWTLAGWRQPRPGDKTALFTFDGRSLRPAY